MKVPSINSIVNKYLTVLTFWVTFCEGLKLIENCFWAASQPISWHICSYATNSYRKQFSTGNESDLRVGKETKLLIGLTCLTILCLKIMPSGVKPVCN